MAHTLTLLQSPPYASGQFFCNLCFEPGSGPVYHCPLCTFDLHVSCVTKETLHTHFTHPEHPLDLEPPATSVTLRACDSCTFQIRGWSFRCDQCEFDLHLLCARAPRFIRHSTHPHTLELRRRIPSVHGKTLRCSGCRGTVSGQVYECDRCEFRLHQACAVLPDQLTHGEHQEHRLRQKIFSRESSQNVHGAPCHGCGQLVKGWDMCCDICDVHFHPPCVNTEHDLSIERNIEQEEIIGKDEECPPLASKIATALEQCAEVPNSQDMEAVKKVMHFLKKMVEATTLHAQENNASNESSSQLGSCTTCLEGFDSTNPRTITSCGHSFHLPCIMEWMNRSNSCPICRTRFEIQQ
ncbi:hypothetical protein KP509_16G051800 [Ceratopteris richardii]|uniref:RING-type domain-containing protein n=2 Tax=Ceratopteris richardii TaxID=49495 RepID=A0A8T2SZL2_CERRI|nr:hypothetical protein KP509_16G051800 [Ceratopteris richardii]